MTTTIAPSVDETAAREVASKNGISTKRFEFALKLARERVLTVNREPVEGADQRETTVLKWFLTGELSRSNISSFINQQLYNPRATDYQVGMQLDPGVYELRDQVYVVKATKDGQRRYAKRLVEIGGERLTEADTIVNIDFEFAPGAIHDLRAEHRMSLERAKLLMVRYGKCINCGRKLKAARSVEAGIGPVCRKAFQ